MQVRGCRTGRTLRKLHQFLRFNPLIRLTKDARPRYSERSVSRLVELPMPPRPNWKGYLKLSLVSCPIALYPASSASECETLMLRVGSDTTGI
jgi:hypothetical protein